MAAQQVRVPKSKSAHFNAVDLHEILYAFGTTPTTETNSAALPSTIAVLDEILTDFIVETCHAAALCASYSRRQKIKVDDFKWVLRKDEVLLGRVLEQLWKERGLKDQRSILDFDKVGAEEAADLAGLRGEGKIKKRRKRKAEGSVGGEGKKRRVE